MQKAVALIIEGKNLRLSKKLLNEEKNKMLKKIVIAFSVLTVLAGLSVSALAQVRKSQRNANAAFFELVKMAREGKSAANAEIVEKVKNAYSEDKEEGIFGIDVENRIVGTWNVHILMSDGGAPPFDALQTFNADRTFVETSSLLGGGTEGPAHGIWEFTNRGYILTFELFVFNPETGEPVGRVRVRNLIRTEGRDKFTSSYAVDFIEPDGTVLEDIDSGIFTATRMRLRGL